MKQEQIFSGIVLGRGYNTLSVKMDDNGKSEVIYIEGLGKRVLNGVNEEFLKRLRRAEWTGGESWERGVNLFVCCDDCNNALFSLFDEDSFLLEDKITCKECGKWLCFDCEKKGFCQECFRGEIVNNLK